MARRLVFHVGGYEPLTPDMVYRRFVREVRRFETTWSAAAAVSPAEVTDNGAAWRVVATGPDWRVETDFRLLRWDDILEEAAQRPLWRRLVFGVLALLDFLIFAFWRYIRVNWRYAGFFLYPVVMLAAFAALGALVGNAVAEAAGSTILGLVAGIAAFALLLRWPGRRFYLPLLFDDWHFSRTYVRHDHPLLAARLDGAGRAIAAAARANEVDEILVIGHSLGAVLAVDLVDRALAHEPALGRRGPRAALLSVGSSILKIGLHRAADRFRAAAARVAAAPGVLWAEYQALTDIMNFYKANPVTEMGLAGTPPVIRKVRISQTLDPAYYRRIKRSFFRIHRQFVSGNDRRAPYDYFMFVCGPLPAERQIHSPDGAASLIGPDGALLLVRPGESVPAPARQDRA